MEPSNHSNIIVVTKSGACFALLHRTLLLVILWACTCGLYAAPDGSLSQSALDQISALLNEKASWTAAQRKMDSQLVHALKNNQGLAFAPGAPNLEMDVRKQPDGRVLVDMKARVTDALLQSIKQGGGDE